MSMEININRNFTDLTVNKQREQSSLNYSSYAVNYTDSTKKTDSKTATEVKANTQASSKDKVEEYYQKLCKKFPEITFNKNGGFMSGNESKVVINLSRECLKKMANNPEFAKKVEFNLTGAVPGQKGLYAKAKGDGAVIHDVTTVIDANGNASVTCGGMTRTSGTKQSSTILNTEKKQKERLEKKREERKALEEKTAKERAKKKAEEKREERKKVNETRIETGEYTISATGMDKKDVIQGIVSVSLGTSASTGASFDVKA